MILVPLGTLWLHFVDPEGPYSNAPGRSQDEPKGCREEQNGAERNLRGAKSKLKVAKMEPKEPKGCWPRTAKDR